MKFHVSSFHIQVLLDCVLGRLFTPKSFESDYSLIEKFDGDTPLKVPDAVQKDQLVAWVEAIKNQQVCSLFCLKNCPKKLIFQLPSWLGLPNNAEKVLLTNRGKQ